VEVTNHCWLLVSTAIVLVPIPVARTAETGIIRPEVFIQQHHEHSPLAYSNPAGLKEGTLIRYGVDRRKNHLYSQISNDGGRTCGLLI